MLHVHLNPPPKPENCAMKNTESRANVQDVGREHERGKDHPSPSAPVRVSWADFWITQGDWTTANDYAAFKKAEQWLLAQQPTAAEEAMVERIAALLYEEATGEPWAVASVAHPGPDRDYYRGLAGKVAAIAQQPAACDMGELCIGCEPRNADGSCPDQQPAADRNVEAEALRYVFGNMDRLSWAQIVDEQMTPPWPLMHHAIAMGLFKDKPPAEPPAAVDGEVRCGECRGTGEVCTGTIDGTPELFDCNRCSGTGNSLAQQPAAVDGEVVRKVAKAINAEMEGTDDVGGAWKRLGSNERKLRDRMARAALDAAGVGLDALLGGKTERIGYDI